MAKVAKRSPKWFGWKPDLPDHRDLRMAPRPTEALPRRSILPSQFVPPVRNQGAQGSCTGHGVRSIMQYMRMKEAQKPLELSPRFAYWNGRAIEGTTSEDSGAEIRDVIKGVAKYGIACERDCKYNQKVYNKPPSKTAFKEALTDIAVEYRRPDQDIGQIRSIIATEQVPITFGFSVYSNFSDADDDGRFGMPSGSLEGGHCIDIVGYDDDYSYQGHNGGVLIMNSWGTDWGCSGPTDTRGFVWMLYDYLLNPDLCDDFWVVTKVT